MKTWSKREWITYIIEYIAFDKSIQSLNIDHIDLSRVDFSELRADGLSAVKTNLEAALFINCSLLDCDFSEANLKNADFSYSDLADCQFNDTNLHAANMLSSKINISMGFHTCFDQAISNAELIGSSFNFSTFRFANLSGVFAQKASFINVDLTGAILKNGNFEGADFTNAILKDVDWTGAEIPNAIFDPDVAALILENKNI